MTRGQIDGLRSQYRTARGNFDLYALFIERAIELNGVAVVRLKEIDEAARLLEMGGGRLQPRDLRFHVADNDLRS